MPLVSSEMTELGQPMPAFRLPDVRTGALVGPSGAPEVKGVLVMFICAHCPYVVHVEDELARLSRDYAEQAVEIFAISANDAERYPDDAPERLRAQAERIDLRCPYLHDEDQTVARAFRAACTPDFFLHDAEGRLYYRGQLDAARPGSALAPDGRDLRSALDALLANEPAPAVQKPSLGCSLKWKPRAS